MGRGQEIRHCFCGRAYTYENFMIRRRPVLMPISVQDPSGERHTVPSDVHTISCWKKGTLVPKGWKVTRYA
jgi:hypothetical protein